VCVYPARVGMLNPYLTQPATLNPNLLISTRTHTKNYIEPVPNPHDYNRTQPNPKEPEIPVIKIIYSKIQNPL